MTSTDFLFRCDGNSAIGSGHIMRCISIADAASTAGISCTFLTASDEFADLIMRHGHACQVLHTDYSNPASDEQITGTFLSALKPGALFVDSYYVTADYLTTLHTACQAVGTSLVYLDDVLAFAYPCDVLINYNIYGPDKDADYRCMYQESGLQLPSLLFGTAYAPLRAEFQGLWDRNIAEHATGILISTGGADAEHTGLGLVHEISRRGQETAHFQFHFVIGSVNEDAPAIAGLASRISNVTLHYNVQQMAALMRSCDLAVSAAGSTLYELCATQTPAITYVLADNQIPGAEGFVRHGVMKSCGDVRNLGKEQLAKRLIDEAIRLADDYEERAAIASRQKKVVDGAGARRIVEFLLKISAN